MPALWRPRFLKATFLRGNNDPDNPDRRKWLAAQSGSFIVGILSGFLPVGIIEAYVSAGDCNIPRKLIESYQGSAVLGTLLVLTLVITYLVLRAKKSRLEQTMERDVYLLFAVVGAGYIANHVWLSHRLFLYAILVIAANLLLSLVVLKGPAPVRPNFPRWPSIALAAAALVAGIALAAVPSALPSGASLWIALEFWTAIAVLLTLGAQWLWRGHLGWFFVALAILIVAAVAFSGRAFQARNIRTLAEAPAVRPTLREFTKAWLAARSPGTKSQPYPIVLVAAAGGGIRAAYWSANLLAAFEDREPAFASHVLAISGVSGGSVGAAVFTSLIHDNCKHCRTSAHEILRRDFLAPALTCLLTRDVLTAAVRFDRMDRAVAMEQAFEHAWSETMHTQTLAQPLAGFHQSPALLLNATEASSAERAVFSNVTLPHDAVQDAAESLSLRLSTAMLLSARFPYISPEGRAGPDNQPLRFVDGGYFDNSGNATLTDVFNVLMEHPDPRFSIVVLSIGNEPGALAGCSAQPGYGGFGTPLTLLDKLRAQRADAFTDRLRTLVLANPHNIFLDHLEPQAGTAEFPLGWALSEATVADMDAQIAKRVQQNDAIRELLAKLRPLTPVQQ